VDVKKIKKNQSSTCPSLCYEDNHCTHFIYSKGYCFLKKFKFVDASPKAAIYNNPGGLCGFVIERPVYNIILYYMLICSKINLLEFIYT